MAALWQDIRYGFRMLMRNPGFTTVVFLILALGIGANTAIFSVVNAVLLRPLPFEHPDRIVQMLSHFEKWAETTDSNNLMDFAEIRNRNHVFDEIAAIKPIYLVDVSGDEPLGVRGARVPAGFFAFLGVKPILGRQFSQEEDQPGSDRVLILSHEYWRQRHGADPGIIGRNLSFKEGSYTVIGVLPPGFRFLDYIQKDVWKPLALTAEESSVKNRNFNSPVIARLKSGVTLEQAQAELNLISSQLMQEYPQQRVERGFLLTPLHERLVAKVRPALWVLFGTVGFVLLIACANVASMLLARPLGRQREIAIRTALGAGRSRLIRQFLTESLMLSLAGGLCALLVTAWSLDVVKAFLPSDIPRLSEIRIDRWVLGFALFASIVTGSMIGLAPALQLSKTSVNQALKEGSLNTRSGRRRSSLHSMLLVSEVALSLMLLIGAGLMIKSFWRLTGVNLGFDSRNLLSVYVTQKEAIYEQPEPYFRTLMDRIRQIPSVQTVAIGSLPLFGSSVQNSFNILGRDISIDGEEPLGYFVDVSEDYFTTLQIPLVMGRFFTEDDNRNNSQPVMIISETIARRYFPDTSPVGETLTCGGKPYRIVGVVGDVHPNGFRSDIVPTVYSPYLHVGWGSAGTYLIVRIRGAPQALFEPIRRELLALNPLRPVDQMMRVERKLSDREAPMRFNTQLLTLFAALALVLASVGVYGVIAFFVSQRTQEIGIRIALGAESCDVLRLVVGQGLKLALVGVVIGLAGAFALTRMISSMLYEVSPMDATTFVGVSLLLGGVSLLASYIPARRATKVDPMVALRYE